LPVEKCRDPVKIRVVTQFARVGGLPQTLPDSRVAGVLETMDDLPVALGTVCAVHQRIDQKTAGRRILVEGQVGDRAQEIPEIRDNVFSGFLQPRKDRPAIGLEIMEQSLFEQGLLVAEGGIKTGLGHAGDICKIAHRRARVTVLPERDHHGMQSVFGINFSWTTSCHRSVLLQQTVCPSPAGD